MIVIVPKNSECVWVARRTHTHKFIDSSKKLHTLMKKYGIEGIVYGKEFRKK